MTRHSRTALLLMLSTLVTVPVMAQDTPVRRELEEVTQFQKLDTLLTFLRQRNAPEYAITTPNGIDEGRYVRIGAIDQWITIRGEDRANPVLLFLHGGPGDVTNPSGYAIFRRWLKYFTVVQWDQRGAGRTLGRNGPSIGPTITVDRMVRDGIELSDSLRAELQKDRIILVGHSWGSVLGAEMAIANPNLFYTFVGTGQVAGPPTRADSVAYDALLREARRRGEKPAVLELEQIGPPPWRDGPGFRIKHKWANLFEHADVYLGSTLGLGFVAPGYSLKDINDWMDGQRLTGEHLPPHTPALGSTFAIPVFVIQGAEDFTTPTSVAREFVASIHAPRKAFITIPNAGHFAVFTRSDTFLQELVERVLPLAASSKSRGARPGGTD